MSDTFDERNTVPEQLKLKDFAAGLYSDISDRTHNNSAVSKALMEKVEALFEGQSEETKNEIMCLIVQNEQFFFNVGFFQGVAWSNGGGELF